MKSIKFKNHKYIGDPINAVKIFNDLGADELVFLDITASLEGRAISLDFIKRVGSEANMPFSVGGGIRNLSDIKNILAEGAEKVVINTYASLFPEFVKHASEEFGSSTIVVSIDVKKVLLGREVTFIYSGGKATSYDPISFTKLMEQMGAGELIINSIDHDGMMQGYDISLIRRISESISIPVVALGGAGSYDDLSKAIKEGYANAVAAGSMFIFHGPRRAVLISYPEKAEISKLLMFNN